MNRRTFLTGILVSPAVALVPLAPAPRTETLTFVEIHRRGLYHLRAVISGAIVAGTYRLMGGCVPGSEPEALAEVWVVDGGLQPTHIDLWGVALLEPGQCVSVPAAPPGLDVHFTVRRIGDVT